MSHFWPNSGARCHPARALVIDVDGTLVDSHTYWHYVWAQVFRAEGAVLRASDRLRLEATNGNPADLLFERTGVRLTSQEEAAVNDRALDMILAAGPLPGALDLIDRFQRHMPVVIASKNNTAWVDAVLPSSIRSRVAPEHIVAVATDTPGKHREAARRAEVQPSSCASVEDSIRGALSARRVHMAGFFVPNPLEMHHRVTGVHRVSSLHDITVDVVHHAVALRQQSFSHVLSHDLG